MFQSYLDKSTPYTPYRWGSTGALLIAFTLRIFFAQGWYIGALYRLQACPRASRQHPANTPQSHTRSASTC
jgi:hypothetical protein